MKGNGPASDPDRAPVQFYATKLDEKTLNVKGNAGASIGLSEDGSARDKAYTRGFHLAGVDIPYPTGDYVQKTGTTSLSNSAALCWVQRCTTAETEAGKVAWVLSLVNGSCPAMKTNISCGGGSSGGSGTWQIQQNIGDSGTNVGAELAQYCMETTGKSCNACCFEQGGNNRDPHSYLGTSCSPKGEILDAQGLAQDTSYSYCTCSYFHFKYICQ